VEDIDRFPSLQIEANPEIDKSQDGGNANIIPNNPFAFNDMLLFLYMLLHIVV
jgi:hypothetical protein